MSTQNLQDEVVNAEGKNNEDIIIDQRPKHWETRVSMGILELPKTELNIYEKMLYVILCGFADPQGVAFPSVKRLVNGTSSSVSQVYRALSGLEKSGLVSRKKRFGKAGALIGNTYEIYGMECYIPSSERGKKDPSNNADSLPVSQVAHPVSQIIPLLSDRQEDPLSQRVPPSLTESTLLSHREYPPLSQSAPSSPTDRHNSTSINNTNINSPIEQKEQKTTLPAEEGKPALTLHHDNVGKQTERVAVHPSPSEGAEKRGEGAGNQNPPSKGAKALEAKATETQAPRETMLIPFEFDGPPDPGNAPPLSCEEAPEATVEQVSHASSAEKEEPVVPAAPKSQAGGSGGAILLSDVPTAMREVADYFLLKTGRPEITPGELSALKALERIHTPARVNAEITTAAGRFEKNQKSLETLTLEYIYDSLKYQVSLKSKKTAKDGGPVESKFDENGKRKRYEPWIEKLGEKYKDCYLDTPAKIQAWIARGEKNMAEEQAREREKAEKLRAKTGRVLLWEPTPYAGLKLPANASICNASISV